MVLGCEKDKCQPELARAVEKRVFTGSLSFADM